MGHSCVPAGAQLWLPTLRRGKDDWQTILTSLADLWTHGGTVDWMAFDRGYQRRKIALPTYPFQRSRYWVKPPQHHNRAGASGHPLLGVRVRSSLKDVVQFESVLTTDSVRFIQDHQVAGRAIMPATGFLEMALAAGHAIFGEARTVEDVVIREPLVFSDDSARVIQLVARLDDRGTAAIEISSAEDAPSPDEWRVHAQARLVPQDAITPRTLSPDAIKARCGTFVTASEHYESLAERGLDFGPALRRVAGVYRRDGEAVGEIASPEKRASGEDRYRMHPALLDACVQTLSAAIPAGMHEARAYLPLSIERFTLFRQPGAHVWSHAVLASSSGTESRTLKAAISVFDDDGVIAIVDGISLRPTTEVTGASAISDSLYELAWRPAVPSAAQSFIDPRELVPAARSALAELAEAHGLARYHAAFLSTEQIAAIFIARALEQLGFRFDVGRRFNTDALAGELGVVPRYHRLLRRLLAILAEDGLLREDDGEWIVTAAPARGDPDGDARALLAAYPEASARTTLTLRCGVELGRILHGVVDPLHLLFPDGSADLAEALYQTAPEAVVYNGIVRAAVARLVAELPPDRRLRVLEVGGGTGATTAWLAPILPPDRADYVFTDIGPVLVERARKKFAEFPFMQFRTLDIENDPVSQGIPEEQFDIIIAANVIHATSSLRETIRNLDRVLAPGGTILMLEVAGLERWIDITFGLTDGWWRFTDTELRADYPLMDRARWLDLLRGLGFEAADLPGESALSREALIAARKPVAQSPTFEAGGDWVILADERGVGDELAARLAAAGQTPHVVRRNSAHAPGDVLTDTSQSDDYLQQFRGHDIRGVVLLWGLDAALPHDGEIGDPLSDQRTVLEPVLSVVQSLGAMSFTTGAVPRLWIVTHGAQPVSDDADVNVPAATLWGLGRVIALEHPELRTTRIDLDPARQAIGQVQSLIDIIARPGTEDQIALRQGVSHLARIARKPLQPAATTPPARRLEKGTTGMFEDMTIRDVGRTAPGPGEVEIRVIAAGLNFRDVMNAMAMREDPEPMGGEFAGQVTAVGDGVDTVAVGDDVIATGTGAFGTYVTTDARFVHQLPQSLSAAQGATLPFAFTTAHYALNTLGKLAAGDRILIHAGAGGVGMAAIQLAIRAGAEVFATAGSREKREYLLSLGVAHAFDSRSLEFTEQILAVTDGAGVDMVLNSLAGEFIPASVSVLSEHGCFLEIGKRDIWTQTQFNAVRPAGRYFAIDLAATRYNDPEASAALLAEVVEMARSGAIRPLPVRAVPLERAADAFRFMAEARHIGKVVLTNPAPERASLENVLPEATYLITGGLTGLGLHTAQRLVARGARHIVLAGRRAPTTATQLAIEQMHRAGAQVVVRSADVSDPVQVRALLDEIDATLPPLRGIVHSAGVLEDGALVQQDWSRFARPLGPKVTGAWALHVLSQQHPLDFFVMYSSVASLLGSSGQGNHAAANAFLDALAHHRRAHGLPALSINWGAWSEIGAAAERNVDTRVATQGVGVIAPDQGLATLELLMQSDVSQAAVLPIDWPRFLENSRGALSPSFTEIARERVAQPAPVRKQPSPHASRPQFRAELEAATPIRRLDMLHGFVANHVARVLGVADPESIDPRRPLNELGLDSLMAVELRNRLGAELELSRSLPATVAFDHPTTTALAEHLAVSALGLPIGKETISAPAPRGDAVGAIAELTDEQIDALFANKDER
jgi:NADPH:quinone reductase-like Zn-dependent oxidoreductase/SAM-dependent methyltransferase